MHGEVTGTEPKVRYHDNVKLCWWPANGGTEYDDIGSERSATATIMC